MLWSLAQVVDGAFSRLAALQLLAKRKLFLVAAPCQPRKGARDNGPLFTTGHTSDTQALADYLSCASTGKLCASAPVDGAGRRRSTGTSNRRNYG
jgi:hypothetical protein